MLREVWYEARRTRVILKDNSIFTKKPQTSHVIQSMKSPSDVADKYAQRLTAYLQVVQIRKKKLKLFMELFQFWEEEAFESLNY